MIDNIPRREEKHKDSIIESFSKLYHFLRHALPTLGKNRFQRNLNDLVSRPDRQLSEFENLLDHSSDHPLIFNDRYQEPFITAIKTTSGDTQQDGEFVQHFLREIKKRHPKKSRRLAKVIDPETNYHPLHFFAERSTKSGDIWYELSEDLMDYVENWADFIGINNPWPQQLTNNKSLRKLYVDNLTDYQHSQPAGSTPTPS